MPDPIQPDTIRTDGLIALQVIEQLPDGRWLVVYPDGRRRPIRATALSVVYPQEVNRAPLRAH